MFLNLGAMGLTSTTAHAAVSGTLTKTGDKSFTASLTVSTSPSCTNTIKATRSGNY
jgi:hypothetical protein